MSYHRDDLVTRACIFAIRVHFGQVRRNKAQRPVIDHAAEVARLVRESGGNDLEVAAGWLHDTVEDTPTTVADIILRFGEAIGNMVDGLTDPEEFNRLPVLIRKMRQAERIKIKSDNVKRVKVADQISNIRDVAIDPPVKWTELKCVDYITGANIIAISCRGVSQYLDEMFEEEYEKALAPYM